MANTLWNPFELGPVHSGEHSLHRGCESRVSMGLIWRRHISLVQSNYGSDCWAPQYIFMYPFQSGNGQRGSNSITNVGRPLSMSERVTLNLALDHTKMFILQSYKGPQVHNNSQS